MKKLLHPATFVLMFFACSICYVDRKYDHVERVFMNSTNSYTLYVRAAGGGIDTVALHMNGPPLIVDDVPAGRPMWALYHAGDSSCVAGADDRYEIHVHSVRDVDGGGWNHGKGGNGQIEVVE